MVDSGADQVDIEPHGLALVLADCLPCLHNQLHNNVRHVMHAPTTGSHVWHSW